MRGAVLGTHISSGMAACIGHAHFAGRVGRRGGVAETYQKAMFFKFKGYMIETQKRSNTEPHGIPEALDRFVGKVVEFSTIWKRPQ